MCAAIAVAAASSSPAPDRVGHLAVRERGFLGPTGLCQRLEAARRVAVVQQPLVQAGAADGPQGLRAPPGCRARCHRSVPCTSSQIVAHRTRG
jgi:hypothetical protein